MGRVLRLKIGLRRRKKNGRQGSVSSPKLWIQLQIDLWQVESKGLEKEHETCLYKLDFFLRVFAGIATINWPFFTRIGWV